MKQKHERKVTRFLITMAVALLVGGICGYLGAMYASSFSGVLAGLGMVLGYAAPVLAALAVCIGCLMARRAYQKAQRLSQSGSDEDVIAALDTLDACIIGAGNPKHGKPVLHSLRSGSCAARPAGAACQRGSSVGKPVSWGLFPAPCHRAGEMPLPGKAR